MVTTRRGAETAPSPAKDIMASTRQTTTSRSSTRTSPFLPTPLERAAVALFPAILVFGTIFSVISPNIRDAPYDHVTQSHAQDPALAPNYFARKSNLFNVIFVKRGWAWVTLAFTAFVLTHPAVATTPRRARAALRWLATTGAWFLVTQWCFGPALIDRGFRWTGGRCEFAEREVVMGDTSLGEMVTAVACKAAGGKWKGGHDISGHVFLLVLGTIFLVQEAGWPILRWAGWSAEERSVVMADGAVKGAGVEAETAPGEGRGQDGLGLGGKFVAAVVALSLWMLLMTAIYFHTWFEKFTGLLTAFLSAYLIYVVPRFVPALRGVLGLPGI